MATRTVYNSATPGTILGDAYMDHVAGHVGRLYDAASFPLASVGGTANVVTASLDPVLSAGLVDGMRFGITWAAANTGAVTLALNGGSAVSVLDSAGAALTAGALASGRRDMIEYIGGAFRVLTQLPGVGGAGPIVTTITSSTTWAKPTGYADDTPVLIRGWGGGGSGGLGTVGAGGGGAGYAERWMRIADIPSSVAASIGAGGAALTTSGNGNAGGTTTFGALLTAYPGGGGSGGSGDRCGGSGGGELAAGSVGSTASVSGGSIGGGDGAVAAKGGDAKTLWGGAAGGGAAGFTGHTGGNAVCGGAGGGGGQNGSSSISGGRSLRGGDGGSGGDGSPAATAGSAPGGGGGGATGGNSGAGARGQIEIWIFA